MKNPKRPNRAQKEVLKSHGLNVNSFLIVKNMPGYIEVVRRTDLKKYRSEGQKIRIRRLKKSS